MNIFIQITPSDNVLKDQAIKLILQKTKGSGLTKKTLLTVWKEYATTIKQKGKTRDKAEEIISFNNCYILVKKTGIFKKTYDPIAQMDNEEIILDGGLKIDKKVYDKTIDETLYSFRFRHRYYNTYSVKHFLNKFSTYIYKGNHGKEIVSRVFTVLGEDLPLKDAKYILGWNNGWILPQLEKKNNYMIIVHTDIQKKVYAACKKMIRDYKIGELELIKSKMRQLIEKTQMEYTKLLINIGWSMAAPFRTFFIDYENIFPHLYNLGDPNTGKTFIMLLFITYFYHVYNDPLSSELFTAQASSKLEDHMSGSTFPIYFMEIMDIKDNNLGILKEHATSNSRFERKKDALHSEFDQPRVAPMSWDSNDPVEKLTDTALNTKIIVLNHSKIVQTDRKWINLFNELKKYKLFSLLYDHTETWTNENLQRKMTLIDLDLKEAISLNEDLKHYQRIIPIYKIIKFGINLFEDIFDIKLQDENILNYLIKSRRIIPQDLVSKFSYFCEEAFKFDTYKDAEMRHPSWPNYIKHELVFKNGSDEHYCFTQNNLRDFKDYIRDNHIKLSQLKQKLIDGIEDKDLILDKNERIKGIRMRYIGVKKRFFDKKKEQTKLP